MKTQEKRWKYPRTPHLPWSVGRGAGDIVIDNAASFFGPELVITEKMDGENTTIYTDGYHARSIDSNDRPYRHRVKALQAKLAHEIPNGMRICGENLYARHSISYDDLLDYFLVFSVWEGETCLSWDDTEYFATELGLNTVPVIARQSISPYVDELSNIVGAYTRLLKRQMEGYVLRPSSAFTLKEFESKVGKLVRPNHVTTTKHWMHQEIVPNRLASGTP